MDSDDEEVIFSQEAIRQQDLLYPAHDFGSEPQSQHPRVGSQAGQAVASGCGEARRAAAASFAGGSAGVADGEAVAVRGRRAHGKIFSDPVHGLFRLDPACVAVIDTPQFQRLRGLHQLGLTHLVFPGAVHTRFEHSLGTAWKAFEVAERIYRTQRLELGMERDDIRIVTLAGLCHDLGHGPFSHVFEYEFLRRKMALAEGEEARQRLASWHHETMSTRILEYLVDENNIEGISGEDIRRISELIRGDFHEDRGWLFDIVNNKRCGVDVDKIDYLQRDALQCSVNIGCDFKRLLMLSKVVGNQIGYKWSEYSNIWDLFHARESMHRKVYTHRKTKAVEFMAVDALLAADDALGFSEAIHTPQEFCSLNDSLLDFIEGFSTLHRRAAPALTNGADVRLREAQALIRRLRRRELYRFGNQLNVPTEFLESGRWEAMSREFTAAEVASCYGGGYVALRPEDVIVSTTKIDFTQGGRNPVDNVVFFDNADDRKGRHIKEHQVVGILPRYHQERILRVYTPHSDPRYTEAVGAALEVWCRRRFGADVQMATPARRHRMPPQQLSQREAAMREADARRGPLRPLPVPAAVALTATTTTAAAAVSAGMATASRSTATGAARRGGGGGASAATAPPGSAPGAVNASSGGAAAAHTNGNGSVAGCSDANADVDGGGGGTPTRSTPVSVSLAAALAGTAGGGGGRGGAGLAAASESQAAAFGHPGTGPRAKRPRSSASLFPDG